MMIRQIGKICRVCTGEYPPISYKNPEFLAQFMTEKGMIKASKLIGLCSKHQRQLKTNIKRARHLALLPFTTINAKMTPQELMEFFEMHKGKAVEKEEGEEMEEGEVEEEREEEKDKMKGDKMKGRKRE